MKNLFLRVKNYHPMRITSILLLGLMAMVTFNCGVEADSKPGLYYQGTDPYILKISDTSDVLPFKKVYVTGAQGKIETKEDYKNIDLTSSDTSAVKISGLRIIGIKKMEGVTIHAEENIDYDFTTTFKVNVVE